MKKGPAIVVSIIFSLLLAVHMIISFIMYVGLDKDRYRDAQIKDDIYLNAGISQEALDFATEGLIDYMEGKRDDLVIINPDNADHELFNSKEKLHMVDVKNLFTLAKRVNTSLFIVLLVILVFYLGYDKESMKKYFLKYSAISLLIILGAWLIIAVLALIDFTSFWTIFHKVLFTNDLWLLNPATDLLIRMMPQRFFTRIVLQILIYFLASYTAVVAILAVSHKILNKKPTDAGKNRRNR